MHPHQSSQQVRPFVVAVRSCDPWPFLPLRVSVPVERTANPRLLWPRLTSAVPSDRLSTVVARRQDARSLRVRRVTFLPSTRPIYAGSVRMTLGLESCCPLAHLAVASYRLRVPRAGSLPSASFGLGLAADTLAVWLGVPVIKASTGTLTRPVNSRLAFAPRLQRQIMTLRVMPDAQRKNAPTFATWGVGAEPRAGPSRWRRSGRDRFS
jgi:hypothetical protein